MPKIHRSQLLADICYQVLGQQILTQAGTNLEVAEEQAYSAVKQAQATGHDLVEGAGTLLNNTVDATFDVAQQVVDNLNSLAGSAGAARMRRETKETEVSIV